MTKKTSVALIIYNHKLLLLLRDDKLDIPNPNTWALPGGIVEDGETHDEGLERGLEEEISIIPKQISYIGKIEYPNDIVGAYYFSKIDDEEYENIKLGDEGQELKFFSFDELKDLSLSGSIKIFADKYKDGLSNILENEMFPIKEDLGLI